MDMPDNRAYEEMSPAAKQVAEQRGPPTAIRVLMPVWGYDFLDQFLNTNLPTLLAPGNLPALSARLPTEFVFLTSGRDQEVLREHIAVHRLENVCRVGFHLIDDLITEGNHSTTVTLAYARAVRETGEAMLDTCFFFLVSDYVMADGSLTHVLDRVMRGASAVQAGNFQVVEDQAASWLEKRLASYPTALALSSRELVQWAMSNIHPTTAANIVNFPVTHNTHTNRLFWRVDSDTLIGRFYLMHMICIRPEVVDFVIGSSCDYSFVPEMCPSGNVAIMTDSDDYLVVEMQARHHESGFLRWGGPNPAQIAESLTEWTTAAHRANARHLVVFHGRDIPATLQDYRIESDAFLEEIARHLPTKPQPYRNHPYWRGALAAYHAAVGMRPNEDDWALMMGQVPSRWRTFARAARFILLGNVPIVRPWHPRWADFRKPLATLAPIMARPDSRILTVSGQPTGLTNWIADRCERATRIPVSRLLKGEIDREARFRGAFDLCVLELTEDEFERVDLILGAIQHALKPGAHVLVAAFNRHWFKEPERFAQLFAANALRFLRPEFLPEESALLSASALRWKTNRRLMRLMEAIAQGSIIDIPLRLIQCIFLLAAAFAANLASLLHAPDKKLGRVISSLFMNLRYVSEQQPIPTAAERRANLGGSLDEDSSRQTSATDRRSATTKEPQYERLLELQRDIGIANLGLMTNQVWYEDPRRLTFILARYKFVAKMLSGQVDVGELGCGDAFGTRIVQQEVKHVSVYDFDPVFIRDIERRQDEKWHVEARVHDILKAPLPHRHNAIYTLDVIEHIPVEIERRFVENLCASLTEHGVLIIGTPSLESQAYASQQSKIGHVNCKSGRQLKFLLERYFHSVFLFSMNDEVVHTGFYPMAHYLFAVCADRKQ
jgi:2-polyprenyl-3-methyl-5-hydroxy-6-metoxy-1,4-benzoquinol methylase